MSAALMTAFSRRGIRRRAWATGVVLTILLTASVASGQEVAYSGSLQFASGDYIFAERTNTAYLFNGLSLKLGAFRASASIPLIYQSSPWVSYAGGGMVPSGGTQQGDVGRQMGHHGGMGGFDGEIVLPDTTTYARMGLGDPLLTVGMEVLREGRATPSLSLTAGAKAPVAHMHRGFGTGEWDYSAGISLAKSVRGALVFVDLGYWVLGDLPDLELEDALAYGIAVGRPLGGSEFALLASLSGYTEILSGVDPPLQLGLGLSYYLDSRRSLSGSAAFGLTESTPDVSLSFGWSFTF